MSEVVKRPTIPPGWSPALPFAALGAATIVAGGLVAAVTAAAPTRHGTWAAAYLVLVVGVAQIGLGVGQALLAPSTPSRRLVAVEFIAWNSGNAAVIAGTLLELTTLVDTGGGLLVFALILLIRGVHGRADRPRWPLYLYRLLIAIVLLSIPIGLVLARMAR